MLSEGEHANKTGRFNAYSVALHCGSEFFIKSFDELCEWKKKYSAKEGKHKRGRRLLNARLNKVLQYLRTKVEDWFSSFLL